MNTICHICGSEVNGVYDTDELYAYFVKQCPNCGELRVPIENRDFFDATEYLPRCYSQNDCYMVNVTDFCTNSCRDCYNRGGKHRDIRDIMDEVYRYPMGSRILVSGGEPLERPNIEFVVECIANGGYKPVLLTNGGLLSEDMYSRLTGSGLYHEHLPQISVSLGIPGTNRSFDSAYDNVARQKVQIIAFSVNCVEEVLEVERIAESLRGQYGEVCIRTSWDGRNNNVFLGDIDHILHGERLSSPTLYGHRSVQIMKNGIRYSLLSWSDITCFDRNRYANRGVWYKGKNVVETLIDEITVQKLS